MFSIYTYISEFYAFTRFKRNDEKKSNFVRTLLGLPHTLRAFYNAVQRGRSGFRASGRGGARCAMRATWRDARRCGHLGHAVRRRARRGVFTTSLLFVAVLSPRKLTVRALTVRRLIGATLLARDRELRLDFFRALSKKNQILNHGAISKFRDKKRSPLGLSMSRIFYWIVAADRASGKSSERASVVFATFARARVVVFRNEFIFRISSSSTPRRPRMSALLSE